MNLQSFRRNLGFLIGLAVLSAWVSSSTVAQEGASVSGRVVDESGDPVIGISIAIQPYKVMGNRRQEGLVPLWERQTDSEGRFSIWPIAAAESVRFVVKSEQREIDILSIKLGELTLYPNNHLHPSFNKIRFSLEAGTEIENAVIRVKREVRPQVRARVVFADGTPAVNAQIRTRMLRRSLDGGGSGSSGSTKQTDAEGYFVADLRVDNTPQFYVLGIEHQGFFAKTPPFILHEGQLQVHLLLTLNDAPIPLEERIPERISRALVAFLNPPNVWVVNPVNGHAYKRIQCHSIIDAMTQATAENAYIVSINDNVENQWLQDVFDRDRFWIGLNDAAEEGQWQWHSGEPVTYTNWEEHERDGGNSEMKDYVIVGYNGRWETVALGEGQAHFVKQAILERADVPIEAPAEDN